MKNQLIDIANSLMDLAAKYEKQVTPTFHEDTVEWQDLLRRVMSAMEVDLEIDISEEAPMTVVHYMLMAYQALSLRRNQPQVKTRRPTVPRVQLRTDGVFDQEHDDEFDQEQPEF